jgi:hypothetical protein
MAASDRNDPLSQVRVEESVEALRSAFQSSVEALALEFRTKKLLPLCRKYHFTYLAGNNDWFFLDQNGMRVNFWQHSAVNDIRTTLNIEVTDSGSDLFGYYIACVTKSELE